MMRRAIHKFLSLQEASVEILDHDTLRNKYPNTYKHLAKQSREAEANTGEPDGEYGTLHSVLKVSPSKRKAEIEHALVHHTVTHMGPDMDYKLTGRLTAQVRRQVPGGDIIGAFEKGLLGSHVEKSQTAFGPKSDRYRHDADKYF